MASSQNNHARDPKTKFAKFLLLTHQDSAKRIRNENAFMINQAIRDIVGKKYCKVNPNGANLLIEVDQKETHDKLLTVTKLKKVPVNIKPHSYLNQCKGTVYCDNISDMSNEEIQEQLKDQDVAEVYRTKRRDGDNYLPTSLFIITFNKTTLPNEVRIGYMNCRVRLYIPNPRICFKCQKFGHGQNTCSHDPNCARCSHVGSDHPKYQDCTNDPKCANCHGDHPASSRQCPMYQLEKKIMEKKLRNNLTYPQARDQIYNEQTELVSQVPTLKVRKNPQTYSTAAAAPAAVNQQQTHLLAQQQQFFLQQQEQMKLMQQQITTLMNLIKGQVNTTIPMPNTSNDMPKKQTVPKKTSGSKRSRSAGSVSSDEAGPTKIAPSNRQEVKQSAEVMETASPSDNVTSEGTSEERGRPSHPPNSSRGSSALPDQKVKERVGSGSSVSTGNKGSDVSKKKSEKTRITGPDPKGSRWK